MDILVAEHGVELPQFEGNSRPVILRQRSGESARSFSQRVAERLAQALACGLRVGRAGLWVSPARGNASTSRRVGLARVLLSRIQGREATSLALGGPLTKTRQGRLDMAALAETLSPLLAGSDTEIELISSDETTEPAYVWPQAA